MIVGVLMGLVAIGLYAWSAIEANKREDKLKARVDQLERWVESAQSKNGF